MSRKKCPLDENSLGGRLRSFREARKKNIIEFSALLGISHGSLSDIENNNTKPSFIPTNALVQNTDINIYWLFTGKGEPTRNSISEPQEPALKDPKIKEYMAVVLKIFQSGNSFAINSMENCLKYLDRTVKTEKRLDDLEDEIRLLKGETRQNKKGKTI